MSAGQPGQVAGPYHALCGPARPGALWGGAAGRSGQSGVAVGAAGLEAPFGDGAGSQSAVLTDSVGGDRLPIGGDVRAPESGDDVPGGKGERDGPAGDGGGAGVGDADRLDDVA